VIRRFVCLAVAALAGLGLAYLSRFWPIELWGPEGLFGIEALRPQGALLRHWLRGTPLAPFELMIWAALAFLALTMLERAFARLTRPAQT